MSTFCDCFAYGFNTTAPQPPDNTTEAIFQVDKGEISPINSMSSSLFFAIVAVMEVEVSR